MEHTIEELRQRMDCYLFSAGKVYHSSKRMNDELESIMKDVLHDVGLNPDDFFFIPSSPYTLDCHPQIIQGKTYAYRKYSYHLFRIVIHMHVEKNWDLILKDIEIQSNYQSIEEGIQYNENIELKEEEKIKEKKKNEKIHIIQRLLRRK